MIEFEDGQYSFHHTVNIPHRDDFPRHMHNGYEILYFVRGDAEYIIEGAIYRLRPGDLLFIRPRTFHRLKPLTEATYERFVIHFPAEKIPPSCTGIAAQGKEIFHVPRDSIINRFFALWAQCEAELSADELREFLYPSVSTAMLGLHHLSAADAVEPIHTHRTLEQILRYIDANPHRAVTADELAGQFYVSTSWIVHSFRRLLGITLGQYVEKKRILFAEAQIRAGTSPTEAAKLCSYENYSTFFRQYKKVLGESPTHTAAQARLTEK